MTEVQDPCSHFEVVSRFGPQLGPQHQIPASSNSCTTALMSQNKLNGSVSTVHQMYLLDTQTLYMSRSWCQQPQAIGPLSPVVRSFSPPLLQSSSFSCSNSVCFRFLVPLQFPPGKYVCCFIWFACPPTWQGPLRSTFIDALRLGFGFGLLWGWLAGWLASPLQASILFYCSRSARWTVTYMIFT